MAACIFLGGFIKNQPLKYTNGCFLKWWYPQIIHFNRVFHYKPSILGYPYFRKPPNGSQMALFCSPGWSPWKGKTPALHPGAWCNKLWIWPVAHCRVRRRGCLVQQKSIKLQKQRFKQQIVRASWKPKAPQRWCFFFSIFNVKVRVGKGDLRFGSI